MTCEVEGLNVAASSLDTFAWYRGTDYSQPTMQCYPSDNNHHHQPPPLMYNFKKPFLRSGERETGKFDFDHYFAFLTNF